MGVLLVALALAVVQLALSLHVRNTLLDAAAEGARFASLAGSSPAEGVERTRDLIDAAIASSYADDVSASRVTLAGVDTVEITVRAALPVIGLIGVPNGLEVEGHAPIETID